jgi:nucleoside-diphosphate-sugar epimerase
MRIAITGASGNVGTALLRRLGAPDQDGHEVVGIVRRIPAGEQYRGVSWHSVDLAEPAAATSLSTAFAGVDTVVHLAWGFQPSHDIDYLYRLGVGGTAAVLQAARTAGVRHLVHMSSVGAYSRDPGRRVDESAPREGIPSLAYSLHKAAAERLLDTYERQSGEAGMLISRLRPGFVLQPDAASALLRYGLPGYLPARIVALLPVLPLDRRLSIPVVHADDLADGIVRVIERRAGGAFNFAGEPPVSRDDVAAALGARPVQVPAKVLSVLAGAGWRLRLQALDPGWLDLAFSVPLLNTDRARSELDWTPAVDSRQALTSTVQAMARRQGADSPVLRVRSGLDQLGKLLTSGPLGNRRLP